MLWEQQGWKASVEVRNFVLGLNDYYADKFDTAESAGMRGSAAVSEAGSPRLATRDFVLALSENDTEKFNNGATKEAGSGPPSPTTTEHDLPTTQDDHWTLAYINPAHMQPISEAVDEDTSGFVSSKEANMFASRRPENWRCVLLAGFLIPCAHLFESSAVDRFLGGGLASDCDLLQKSHLQIAPCHEQPRPACPPRQQELRRELLRRGMHRQDRASPPFYALRARCDFRRSGFTSFVTGIYASGREEARSEAGNTPLSGG